MIKVNKLKTNICDMCDSDPAKIEIILNPKSIRDYPISIKFCYSCFKKFKNIVINI